MQDHWYYAKANTKHGPHSVDEIRRLAESGDICPVDLVWKTGMDDWQTADSIHGLFVKRSPPPLPNADRPKQNSTGRHSEAEASSQVSSGHSAAAPTAHGFVRNCVAGLHHSWTAIQDFWVRIAAWLISVIRQIGSEPVQPEDLPATFSLSDVFSPDATDAAGLIPKAKATGLALHWLLIAMIVAGLFSMLFGSPAGGENSGRSFASIWEADREFEIAASRNSEDGRVVARMLIELRNEDGFSWERLQGEVEFQFEHLESEFLQWKADRVNSGDRFE